MKRRGEAHMYAKLTAAKIREIAARIADGEKQRLLAREYGVSEALISNIKHGKCWTHVERSGERATEGGDPVISGSDASSVVKGVPE